jgi:hypothetical protein
MIILALNYWLNEGYGLQCRAIQPGQPINGQGYQIRKRQVRYYRTERGYSLGKAPTADRDMFT